MSKLRGGGQGHFWTMFKSKTHNFLMASLSDYVIFEQPLILIYLLLVTMKYVVNLLSCQVYLKLYKV